MAKIKVRNMCSERSNREVPDQFIIEVGPNTYFQSYRTVIAAVVNGKIYLDPAWNCSRTTSKYRSQFLGEKAIETRKKIKEGKYVVTRLN